MSNLIVRSVKNLNKNQKIYLGIALFLFLLQFFLSESNYVRESLGFSPVYISIFSAIGLVIALIRRSKSRKLVNDKSLLTIVSNDYNLSSYASLSILSLLYAVFQGLFYGAGLGCIFYGLGSLIVGNAETFALNIAAVFLCLLITVIIRVLVEGTSLIFRVAEDISKSVNK